MKKFEEKFGKSITKDYLKIAKNIISDGSLLACIEKSNDHFFVVRNLKNSVSYIKYQTIAQKIKQSNLEKLKPEEIACLLYLDQFTQDKTPKENTVIKKEKKIEVLPDKEEAEQPSKCKGEIFLKINEFPNAQSTWEPSFITVTLIVDGKEYTGNSNKLRQLRFDEGKSSSFTIRDFDSHSRQIIRFLSQNAEADGSSYNLKADLMSDLMHCLKKFNKFFDANGKRVIVHSEEAEIVSVYSGDDKKSIIPSLYVNGKVIDIFQKPSFVLGKSGIWVGRNGEYWWVPATVDLIWLRKFLMTELPISLKVSSPVRQIDAVKPQLTEKECITCCFFDFNYEKNNLHFTVKILFRYDKFYLDVEDSRIFELSGGFILRDKLNEELIVKKILKFGFKPVDSELGLYLLNDSEAIGLFINNVFGGLKNRYTNINYTHNAANLIFSQISRIHLKCYEPELIDDTYKFTYELGNGDDKLLWHDAVKAVKSNRRYIISKYKIFKLTPDFSDFVKKVNNITTPVKDINNKLQIPKGSVIYWVKAAEKLKQAVPKEWLHFMDIDESKDKEIDIQRTNEMLMLKQFEFVGILREYQKTGVNWLLKMVKNGLNVVLADEMGLGKTVQSLAFILNFKSETKTLRPSLIVCPTSLVDNWLYESKKFTPNLKTIIIKGQNRQELTVEIKNYDIVITSYALIKRDVELYADIEFDVLILDEAQHIKNPATVNSKTCKTIKAAHRIVLTGTPLENSPEDLWSIFDFLNVGMLGTKESFKSSYSKIENDLEKQKELSQRIAPFVLRRHKNEVEQLPEKTEQILYCEMSQTQQAVYNRVLQDGKFKYSSMMKGNSTRFDVLTSLLRLRQICCHPMLLPQLSGMKIDESAKTELLEEIVFEAIDSGHRTLIFSQFTSLLAILKKWSEENKILYEYLDGNTKNRFERVQNFNNNHKINLFLLSLKAGGTGLNLTGADTVVIYDPWWNPSAELQATDRAHRIGQTKSVTTFKLVVKNSIEEKILELQDRKKGLFNGIIENTAAFNKLTDKDIGYLLD